MFNQYKCIADTDATNIKEEGGQKSSKEPFPVLTVCNCKSEETQYDTKANPQKQHIILTTLVVRDTNICSQSKWVESQHLMITSLS